MLAEMTDHVEGSGASKEKIMLELANTIGLAVKADTTKLYLVESEGKITLHRPDQESGPREEQVIGEDGSSVQRCATQGRSVVRSDKVS